MVQLKTHELVFLFGLLGNIISFLVFLAPVPTFYKIFKKKSTQGYQSIPYIVALASAMLLLYYGYLIHAFLIVTINTFGCAIELTYLILYLIYASKKNRISTIKFISIFNIAAYGSMLVLVNLVIPEQRRVTTVGSICAAYSVAVFAAPLSIMRQVISTKSVEYMPFLLSFFLTLSATMWFFYGILIKNLFIALPNVLGFIFGLAQMILYMIYKDSDKNNFEQKSNGQQGRTGMALMDSNRNPNVFPNNDQNNDHNV